jgi:hypothetical protein
VPEPEPNRPLNAQPGLRVVVQAAVLSQRREALPHGIGSKKGLSSGLVNANDSRYYCIQSYRNGICLAMSFIAATKIAASQETSL